MAKHSYTALQTRPTYKQSMDDDVVVAAVDNMLSLVKARTDAGEGSWPFQLAAATSLTITQVRRLLKLGVDSRRAKELWPGFILDRDMSNGYRVVNKLDDRGRTQMLGVVKTCETRLHNEVGGKADLTTLTDVERLFVQMAETRASEMALMREMLAKQPDPATV